MLLTILAWLYITAICWVFGFKFFQLLGNIADSIKSLHFGVVCMVGLAVLTAIGSYLSLITGLNTVLFHTALLLLFVSLLFTIPKNALVHLRTFFSWRSPILFAFVFVSVLVVLIMSVWHIKHPDTVEYHSAIIESIKDNKIPKGFALQNLRYGLQSNWFVSCALFSFDFFPFYNLTFINSVILFWLICFIGYKVNSNSFFNLKKHDNFSSLLWIAVLAIAFWDYTQIRLTATSASADFPTALYILLTCILFYSEDLSPSNILLLIFLITTAFCQKLFSFPLMVILLFLGVLLTRRSPFSLISAFFIFLLTIAPFLLRNYFTSGQPLYPTSLPFFSSIPWQINHSETRYLQDYIKAYARTASSEDSQVVQQIAKAPLKEWLPQWWTLRSLAQKTILISLGILVMLSLGTRRLYQAKFTYRQAILFIISIFGLYCWFMLAPDPRFGTAYLILLLGLIADIIIRFYCAEKISTTIINFSLGIFTLALLAYLMYRLIYFFDVTNILVPYSL